MKRALLIAMACSFAAACSQPDKRMELLESTALNLQTTFEAGPTAVRYNPVECDCPPFEAQADDRWIRVALPEDPESAAATLLATGKSDLEDGALATYQVSLELDSSSPHFCANGTPFFEVELLGE